MDGAYGSHDVCLGPVVHGQIGMIPVAQHAEANEILLLPLDLFFGVGSAQRAELGGRDRLAVLLLHLQFDRQPVTIPARNIGCVKTGQRFAFDDDVLQYLVHRMADMDVPVCIRRAVVQDEHGLAPLCRTDLLIALLCLPARQHLRLAAGQVTTHRERGV